jgi:hypothetical protein
VVVAVALAVRAEMAPIHFAVTMMTMMTMCRLV